MVAGAATAYDPAQDAARSVATYETDVAARKPRAEYTRGLTIAGEAWDHMGNLTEVVYSISFVY